MLAEGRAVPFDTFMEWALYRPEQGYYRKSPRQVFGRRGDFFTASQVQPAFGELIASLLSNQPILELGPGAGEMRAAFAPGTYVAVEYGDLLPPLWKGAVFANEFFDALPVAAGIRQGAELYELLVVKEDAEYRWQVGAPLSAQRREYVARYYPELPDGWRFEIAEQAIDWIRRLSQCVSEGTVLIIDYGWAGNEYLRFPEGTLMSYRRHRALSGVLARPGTQDITAHVPFQPLMDAALHHGFAVQRFETLDQTLLTALKRAPHLLNEERDRAQVKTLLFGMGETFRTLVLTKHPTK